MGSLRECENFTLMSKDFDYISQEEFVEIISDIQRIGARLGGLIKTIRQDINRI